MDLTAIRKLLTEAHACMRACGWQLATAGDPQSDGVLEAACSDVEERMGEYLSAPDPRDATIAALRAEVERKDKALRGLLDWAGPIAGDNQDLKAAKIEVDTCEAARAALGDAS
jgi:hypothetical protein